MARGRGYAESSVATPASGGVTADRGAPMSDARRDTLHAKRVLLLQGPVGPFFRRLATLLRAAGAEVHKVNFNGGDCLFFPTDALTWRGHPPERSEEHTSGLPSPLNIGCRLLLLKKKTKGAQ